MNNPGVINNLPWDALSAQNLAREIEEIAPKYGYHVALTGGCLYKDGPRKDVDLLIYPIDGAVGTADQAGFLIGINKLITITNQNGSVMKGETTAGWPVDLMFPDITWHDYLG
jgi:hypothetical protein